jgi:hypothetical protein
MNILISLCIFFLLPNVLLNAPKLVLAIVYEYGKEILSNMLFKNIVIFIDASS